MSVTLLRALAVANNNAPPTDTSVLQGGSRSELLLNGLLLGALMAGTAAGSTDAATARCFVASRILHDAVQLSARQAGGSAHREEVSRLIAAHRQLLDSPVHPLGALCCGVPLRLPVSCLLRLPDLAWPLLRSASLSSAVPYVHACITSADRPV
jgi:hypothetical protein